MKKLGILMMCCFLFVMSGCNLEKETTVKLEDFEHLTLDELDQKLADKETIVVYFGWTQNCGDSQNFQNNYLLTESETNPKLKEIYIVDLDKELPDALEDKEKREPLKEKYEVEYSPTLVSYEEGKLSKLLSWTPATTDKNTGILKADLDAYFTELGYLEIVDKK